VLVGAFVVVAFAPDVMMLPFVLNVCIDRLHALLNIFIDRLCFSLNVFINRLHFLLKFLH